MKNFLLVILLAAMGCRQPKAVQMGWKPEMCRVQQDEASEEYIRYCMKVSPNDYPACHGMDPQGAMWAMQVAEREGKQGAYFEVLDCSWHPGGNPREESRQ